MTTKGRELLEWLATNHRVSVQSGDKLPPILCPAHDDHNPSLGVWLDSNGRLVLYCRSQRCEPTAIRKGLGLPLWEKPPTANPCGINGCPHSRDSQVAIYKTTNPDVPSGELCTHRQWFDDPADCWMRDHPTFKCSNPSGPHKEKWGRGSSKGAVLLAWGDDDQDSEIVLVEGEKAAAAVQRHIVEKRLIAYSWRGGASAAHLSDYSPVKGRAVTFFPDADDAGSKSTLTVIDNCYDAGASEVRLVDVSGLPHKADAADLDTPTFLTMLKAAQPMSRSYNGSPRAPWFHDYDRRHIGQWESTYLAAAHYTLRFNAEKLLAVQYEDRSWGVYVDNGRGIWVVDRGAVHSGITRALSAFALDCWKAFDREEVKRTTFDAVVSWQKRLRNSTQQDKVMDSVSEVITRWKADRTMPPQLLTCRESDLDRPGQYIGTPDGVVDLKTAKVLSPAEGREHLVTQMIADPYDQAATDPAAEKLLSHLSKDERQWLVQGLGFALRLKPNRRIYLLRGRSGGGKTTLLNHISSALGDYMQSIPSGLLEKGLSRDGGNPELDSVVRPAIAFRCEPPDEVDVAFLKTVSGADEVVYRWLYSNKMIRRKCTATIVIACNLGKEPKLPLSRDDGLRARVRVLEYPQVPESQFDGNLDDKLSTIQARQAVVAALVNAARTTEEPPADILPVKLESEKLREQSQSEAEVWLRSVLRPEPGEELLAAYFWQEALEAAGEKPDSNRAWGLYRNKLSKLASSLGLMPTSRSTPVGPPGNRVRVFKGVRMLPPGAVECQLCGQEYPDGEDAPAFDAAHGNCQDAEACKRIQVKNSERTAVQYGLTGG